MIRIKFIGDICIWKRENVDRGTPRYFITLEPERKHLNDYKNLRSAERSANILDNLLRHLDLTKSRAYDKFNGITINGKPISELAGDRRTHHGLNAHVEGGM